MIKIGVVGFGLRAGGIYKILKEVDPEFCLGGIVDPDEKRVRQELPENERNVDFYSDIAGLAGRGKVDALLIGTRCNLHTELAVEALKYDIPVWLEKPVAISMEQALMHIGEARMTLNKKGERFLTHGAEVVCPGIEELPKDTPLRAYCNGKFLGIAKSNGEAVHICTFLGQEEE